jgi:hypothetical protein
LRIAAALGRGKFELLISLYYLKIIESLNFKDDDCPKDGVVYIVTYAGE